MSKVSSPNNSLINAKDAEYANSYLKPFYDSGLIPAEKKPYLTKLSAGLGPYLALESSTGQTHYMLDAASQIATLGHGFNPSSFFGTAHHQGSWSNDPQDPEFLKLVERYREFFKRKLTSDQCQLTFTNSGAEGNEMAIGMAFHKRRNKKAKKILAFEGSFHGRMLLSLYSTWNPAKREPFQWQGYETAFSDYPELPGDDIHQDIPSGWAKYWEAPFQDTPKEWSDEILVREVEALKKVQNQFASGEIFVVLIEPMQCEGGDRYSSSRFHQALLLLAKNYGVSVVYDEVQTGFHLGREFFWHRQFDLKDSQGHELRPDYIVCAKKSQVGIVINFDNDALMPYEDQQFQVASVIRGYIHALGLDQAQGMIQSLEEAVRPKLDAFLSQFSEHLGRPRVKGMSFAFEVNDQSKVNEFISERFNHGLLYYPAGAQTLRFRLNTAFKERDIDFLFGELTKIANKIYHGKEEAPGTCPIEAHHKYNRWNLWHQKIVAHKQGHQLPSVDDFIEQELEHMAKSVELDLELIALDKSNFDQYRRDIENLQTEVYEPARQTSIETFQKTAYHESSVNYVLKIDNDLCGIIFAGPLDLYPLERGLRIDPDFNDESCLYMIDTTIHHKYQYFGLGRFLKFALTLKALETNHKAIKGRNRDRLAAGMLMINLSLGAYEQNYLFEDYPDFAPHRDVLYYTQNLGWHENQKESLGQRLYSNHRGLTETEEYTHDQIPRLVNKVCLSNFVDAQFVKELSEVASNLPESLRHIYTASGQAECVDKIAKSILFKDAKAFGSESYFITFEGHQFGLGSNMARSLGQYHFSGMPSDKESYFPIKVLPHLSMELSKKEKEEILKELESLLKDENSKGLWLEPVRQRDYSTIDLNFLKEIKRLCQENNKPLIYNETASQEFTATDEHYFLSSDSDYTPDASMVFCGGQMALCFLNEEFYISKPLMMISTWDGDQYALNSYVSAMKTIQKNKQDYLETRERFREVIKGQLNQELSKVRGLFHSNLPLNLREKMRKTSDGYLLDPSFGQMKKALSDGGL